MSASRDAVARGRHDSDVAVRRGARRSCVRPSSKSPGRAAARVRPRPDGRTSITPNHDLNNFEKKRGKRMNRNRATEQDGRDRRHRRRARRITALFFRYRGPYLGHSRARVCVWHAAGAHDRREASFPDNLALGCVFTKAKSKDPGRHLARRTTAPKQTIFALKGAGEPTNHSFMSLVPFAVHSDLSRLQCSFKPNNHSAISSGTFSTEQTRAQTGVAPMGLNSPSRSELYLG